jgi:exosome complex exonuclease RRP6
MSCLIQVSTHSKDYIIDPFDIWADLTLLNEITADPKIVKVRVGRQIGMILRE